LLYGVTQRDALGSAGEDAATQPAILQEKATSFDFTEDYIMCWLVLLQRAAKEAGKLLERRRQSEGIQRWDLSTNNAWGETTGNH